METLLPRIAPFQQGDLASLADILTPESFEKELAVRERLDGMIDRCIKRLIHLKVGKRMVELEFRPKMLPKPNGNPRPKLCSV